MALKPFSSTATGALKLGVLMLSCGLAPGVGGDAPRTLADDVEADW